MRWVGSARDVWAALRNDFLPQADLSVLIFRTRFWETDADTRAV